MATCLRECEACEYGGTCPTSCRYDRVIGRSKTLDQYHKMNDGIIGEKDAPVKTSVRIWYGKMAVRRPRDDYREEATQIWDDTLDIMSGN